MLQANYTEIYDCLIFLYSSIPNSFLISFYALLLVLMKCFYLYQTSAVTVKKTVDVTFLSRFPGFAYLSFP